jgi:DNA polymerase-1
VLRKTPTGQPSTAEDVLEELAEAHDLPRLILEYRGLAKLKSTYTDKLPEQINERTGRVHTSYHQAVAQTGGCPRRTRTCRTSRSARRRAGASARPSSRRRASVLLAADYSQIELRIMAHLSGDAGCCAPSPKGATCTRPPPPKCSATKLER